MDERALQPVLPDGVDDGEYLRIRSRMRFMVLKVWGSDHVVAGTDPWTVVDEAWSSMAEKGFRSQGPFLPFALRVAQNKAIDARNRAEVRRRDRSLHEPLATWVDDSESLVLADVAAGSAGAEADYFSKLDHVEITQQLSLAEEAIYNMLSDEEREVFLAVRVSGKSRAAVGRELDPPLTGQRVGQIVAAAWIKVKTYIDEQQRTGER